MSIDFCCGESNKSAAWTPHCGDRVLVHLATGDTYGVIVETYYDRGAKFDVMLEHSTVSNITQGMMEFTGESIWY